MLGIYEHGFGNWDLIKTDSDLKMAEKANVSILFFDTKSGRVLVNMSIHSPGILPKLSFLDIVMFFGF